MPCAYYISRKSDLVCHQLSGHVTLGDLRTLLTASREDPAFHPGMDIFIAMDDVTGFGFGFDGMAALSAHVVGLYGRDLTKSRRVVHAPSDLAFGMARMYGTLLADVNTIDVHLFRRFEDAARTLGRLPASPLQV